MLMNLRIVRPLKLVPDRYRDLESLEARGSGSFYSKLAEVTPRRLPPQSFLLRGPPAARQAHALLGLTFCQALIFNLR